MTRSSSQNLDYSHFLSSNQRVFIHGAAATPSRLIGQLLSQAAQFRNVEIMHLHTFGEAAYANPEYNESFHVSSLFVGANLRKKMKPGVVDYIPCFLSEIPKLFRSGRRAPDLAILQVSAPDKHGYCTLGTSVDIALAACESAKFVIAEINKQMPRVHGDGFIPFKRFAASIEVDEALPELPLHKLSPEDIKIGHYCASLIEDSSTLQAGIGSIPDAILQSLKGHKHLGIHTETWSDGMMDLILSGAVDNSCKRIHVGKTVSGFVQGTRKLYDFIHDNPSVVQLDVAYVNNVEKIAKNPKVVAINSAVEIDLTGQICADSVGSHIISGVGGQMDFMRGASLSQGGKPIIAISSRTQKGESKIVMHLKPGAGVVTTRAHVHYVVTEYGIADLYGKTLNERAKALIAIAHPEDRERLSFEWKKQ